jgi:hypothetical protein
VLRTRENPFAYRIEFSAESTDFFIGLIAGVSAVSLWNFYVQNAIYNHPLHPLHPQVLGKFRYATLLSADERRED